MGDYTSLVISARLRPDMPIEYLDSLKALISGEIEIVDLLGGKVHRNPLRGSSAYSPEGARSLQQTTHPSGWTLNVVSSTKNYDQEIELFLEWIRPYVSDGHGELGWWAIVTREEQHAPTIHYLHSYEHGEDLGFGGTCLPDPGLSKFTGHL